MKVIVLANDPASCESLKVLLGSNVKDNPNLLIANTVAEVIQLVQNQEPSQSPRLPLATTGGYLFVKTEDIVHCKADGRYTVFHLIDRTKHTIAKNIGEFELILKNFNFLRVHRSQIINLSKIKKYIKGRPVKLVLEDETQVLVSHAYRKLLLHNLNLAY